MLYQYYDPTVYPQYRRRLNSKQNLYSNDPGLLLEHARFLDPIKFSFQLGLYKGKRPNRWIDRVLWLCDTRPDQPTLVASAEHKILEHLYQASEAAYLAVCLDPSNEYKVKSANILKEAYQVYLYRLA